jgi:hypothetical protein
MAFLRPKNLKTDHADLKIKIRNAVKAQLDKFLDEVSAAGFEFDLDAALEAQLVKLIEQTRKDLARAAAGTGQARKRSRKRPAANGAQGENPGHPN